MQRFFVVLLASFGAHALQTLPRLRLTHFQGAADHPTSANCTENWFTQKIDHFSPSFDVSTPGTFKQRYFTCRQTEWNPAGGHAPVFFYTGNEADVTLYVNASGLMWESAPEFGALLVFAEHRYFGESVLFGGVAAQMHHLQYLSTEQALADYATLIAYLRTHLGAPTNPFIAFGGSYGGMLSSWLRMKYPAAVQGAIAGSAPIMSFLGENPPYDTGSYAKIVSFDASKAGGAVSDACSDNVRRAWPLIFKLGSTAEGRSTLARTFSLCENSVPQTVSDVYSLAYWLQSSMDYMAMGSYPYPSSYILNGEGVLPPYPIREMCKPLERSGLHSTSDILGALREGVGVFYNYSKNETCYDIHGSANNATTEDGHLWDYLFCAEMTQPMSRDGVHDMFWSQPFNLAGTESQCLAEWNVTVRPDWATTLYGGWAGVRAASNIFFSNGQLDPWKGGGVTTNVTTDRDVVAMVIAGCGHHMDLMFSNPLDPPSVKEAREAEKAYIAKWCKAHVDATDGA